MNRVLAITAILAGLGIAGPRANAQGCIVNGRDATTAEVQLLVSHGARSGSWSVRWLRHVVNRDRPEQAIGGPPAAIAGAGKSSTSSSANNPDDHTAHSLGCVDEPVGGDSSLRARRSPALAFAFET